MLQIFYFQSVTPVRSFSPSISLICCVVVRIILLVNLIPPSLSSISALSLYPSFSLSVLLRVPLGSTGNSSHVVSPVRQRRNVRHTHTHEWKRSQSPDAPGGHALDYALCSDSAQRLCTIAVTHSSYMHGLIQGIKSCTFCSPSLTLGRASSTHTSQPRHSLLMFSHPLQNLKLSFM